jgi:hypothetical protein
MDETATLEVVREGARSVREVIARRTPEALAAEDLSGLLPLIGAFVAPLLGQWELLQGALDKGVEAGRFALQAEGVASAMASWLEVAGNLLAWGERWRSGNQAAPRALDRLAHDQAEVQQALARVRALLDLARADRPAPPPEVLARAEQDFAAGRFRRLGRPAAEKP